MARMYSLPCGISDIVEGIGIRREALYVEVGLY